MRILFDEAIHNPDALGRRRQAKEDDGYQRPIHGSFTFSRGNTACSAPRLSRHARPSLPPSSLLLAPAQCHIHIFQSLSVSKGDDFCRRASPCMDGRGRTWTFARSLDRLCSWALGNAGRRQRHSFEPISSSVTEGEHFLLLFVVLRALTLSTKRRSLMPRYYRVSHG